MRLIDADNLLNDLMECVNDIGNSEYVQGYNSGLNMAIREVLRQSVITPVKHGKWIPKLMKIGITGYFHDGNNCSNCGRWTNHLMGYDNYCPECGAKMDLGIEDENNTR